MCTVVVRHRFVNSQVEIRLIRANITNSVINFIGDGGFILLHNSNIIKSSVNFYSNRSPTWSDNKQVQFQNVNSDGTYITGHRVKCVL